MSIKIRSEVYEDMVDHSKELLPIESCGYLAGKDGEVTRLYRMYNVDQSPEHFSFDPKEQFAVVKAARQEGLQILGVYHSHPESPARLSQEDLRLLKDPSMTYFIVSLMNQSVDVKAFRIRGDKNEQVEIVRSS